MSDLLERANAFLAQQWQFRAPAHQPTSSVDSVMTALLSGKWRRSAIDGQSRRDTEYKVTQAMKSGSPLEFSIPFGGYKSLHARSYPHLNWADVFAVNFLRRYGESVAAVYTGPLIFTFSYCSAVMDIVNNMPLADQNCYLVEFERILGHFSDTSVRFRLFDIGSLFATPSDLKNALLVRALEIERQWYDLPADVVAKRLGSAARNLHLKGGNNYGKLSSEELRLEVERSAILCEALDSLPQRRNFNKFSERIQLVHVRGPIPAIHIASCDTSANHFGVGTGVVEMRASRCLQRILTGPVDSFPKALVNFEADQVASREYSSLTSAAYIAEGTLHPTGDGVVKILDN